MAAWLVDNFIWIAVLIVLLVVGLKVAIAGFLKRLMDESAARQNGDGRDTRSRPKDDGTR